MTTPPSRVLGINGIRLLERRTGVGRALESVLECMEHVPHPFREIRVYTQHPLPDDVKLPSMARNVVLPSLLPKGLWEQLTLPRGHGRQSLLICPSYVAPVLARCPVLLIHHGSYEGYPQAFSWLRRTKARIIHTLSAHAADLISTVSEHSRRDIMRFYRIKPEKLRVVPEGVDTKHFKPIEDAARLAQWRVDRLGADVPCFLYVGKPTKRRNLPNLVRALARLKLEHDLPHRLILIGTGAEGPRFSAMAEQEGAPGAVQPIDFAGHEEIVLAYNASEMLVYPSSYEGFGMPVLEAMACGTPAIALNNTAFPEFAGGIAKLLEDAEVETLQAAMWDLLNDQERRDRIRVEGPERAAEYDWMRVTERYVELMKELIAE